MTTGNLGPVFGHRRGRVLTLTGVSGDFAYLNLNVQISGDMSVRMNLSVADWTPGAEISLCGKFASSYLLRITATGEIKFYWYDGTLRSATSSAATGFTDGSQHSIRADLDVDNGAAGCDVLFYTSEDNGASWTQLGTTQTQAFTTSISVQSAVFEIGSNNSGTAALWAGSVYWVRVHSDLLGGLPVIDFNPRSTKRGSTSWSSWEIAGSAVLA